MSADETDAPAVPSAADHYVRLVEAILFASAEPVDEGALARRLPTDVAVADILAELAALYRDRGVNLTRVGKGWALRTAADLAPHLRIERTVQKKLSRAAIETLAIIAYHQPVTRAEIEEIRGVGSSKGTFEALLEAGFIRPRGRRQTPGRPVTWATTDRFLDHFELETVESLPGLEELKAAGLLDARPAIHAYGAAETDDAIEDEGDDEDGQPELGLEEELLDEAFGASDPADGAADDDDA
ncbi:MAG: SMC-Scp complex subunit ScpB [Alphaproteobacteria bacterium]